MVHNQLVRYLAHTYTHTHSHSHTHTLTHTHTHTHTAGIFKTTASSITVKTPADSDMKSKCSRLTSEMAFGITMEGLSGDVSPRGIGIGLGCVKEECVISLQFVVCVVSEYSFNLDNANVFSSLIATHTTALTS